MLVAFNQEAYDNHVAEVRGGGVVIYDSDQLQLEDDGNSFGMPIQKLARSTGNNRAANMVIIGAVARLVNMPHEYLEQFVVERFTRGRANDQQIIESNIKALALGRDQAVDSGFHLGNIAQAEKPPGKQLLIKGNDAISLGAVAAGINFYVGYPISPATPVLLWMERNLVGPDKFAYQVSSELESITALLGAGFAGKKAMTATAGPGFSLMAEGLGLGLDGGDSPGSCQRPARWPRHRPPHQDGAIGPAGLPLPRPRRRESSRHRPRHRGGVLLRRHRSLQLG